MVNAKLHRKAYCSFPPNLNPCTLWMIFRMSLSKDGITFSSKGFLFGCVYANKWGWSVKLRKLFLSLLWSSLDLRLVFDAVSMNISLVMGYFIGDWETGKFILLSRMWVELRGITRGIRHQGPESASHSPSFSLSWSIWLIQEWKWV